MTTAEIQREVVLALDDGLQTYDAASLAADLNAHELVDEHVTDDVAAALLDAIRQQKMDIAEQVARDFEQQLDVNPMTSSGGQPVAADGGSLFSDTTYDTLTVGGMFINGLTIGGQLQSGGLNELGAVAVVAVVLLMIGWFGRKYDIDVTVSSDGFYH